MGENAEGNQGGGALLNVAVPSNIQLLVSREITSSLSDFDITLTMTGLSFGRELSMSEKCEALEIILRAGQMASNGLKWAIADIVNQIPKESGFRGKSSGVRKSQLEEVALRYGYVVDTIYNIAAIGERFPKEMRFGGLSFSAYNEMKGLDRAKQWDWINKAKESPGSVSGNRIALNRKAEKERDEWNKARQVRLDDELKCPVEIPIYDSDAEAKSVLLESKDGVDLYSVPQSPVKFELPEGFPDYAKQNYERMAAANPPPAISTGPNQKQLGHEGLDAIWPDLEDMFIHGEFQDMKDLVIRMGKFYKKIVIPSS